VKVAHTELAKEAGMETVHVGAVLVHTTGLTTTSWMLAVLTNATVTGRNVSAKLACLFQSRYLQSKRRISICCKNYREWGWMEGKGLGYIPFSSD